MDRSQQWLRVVSAAEAPRSAADRSVALRMAMELGTSVVPASVGCSVTERAGAGYRTVSSANALSLALDHAQYAADEGPCLLAADDGTRQHVDVLADRTRFPAYADAAVARGVRSSLSVPVPDPGRAGPRSPWRRASSDAGSRTKSCGCGSSRWVARPAAWRSRRTSWACWPPTPTSTTCSLRR